MKRALATFAAWMVAVCAFGGAGVAALAPGATAPGFSAPAALAGHELKFALADELRKGPVVVYFYPSAFTGGCDLEAHTFAEQMDQFRAAGASVVGVSLDSIQRLVDFSSDPQYCAGKIAVVSDHDGKIAKSYDVPVSAGQAEQTDVRGQKIGHDFAKRTTFVVDQDGKVVASISDVSPKDHVDRALVAVQRLKKPGA